jgi:hypothetical protein
MIVISFIFGYASKTDDAEIGWHAFGSGGLQGQPLPVEAASFHVRTTVPARLAFCGRPPYGA